MIIARELYPNLPENDEEAKKDRRYKKVKNGNFSIVYGASEKKADETYGFPGAFQVIRKRFTHLSNYMDEWIKVARKDGIVPTMFGRKLAVNRISAEKDKPYVALSRRVQGTAGEVIKRAMLNLSQLSFSDFSIINQVHDELIIELPQEHRYDQDILYMLIQAMEEPGTEIGVPTTVSPSIVTRSWDQAKPIKKPKKISG
jgi:DNA polymerase I-like protein with 3'-5' exonuclease and polymerase domains